MIFSQKSSGSLFAISVCPRHQPAKMRQNHLWSSMIGECGIFLFPNIHLALVDVVWKWAIPKEWWQELTNTFPTNMKFSKDVSGIPRFRRPCQPCQSGGKWNGSCRNASAADSTSGDPSPSDMAGRFIWQCVKTLYPCSSHQNSW